MRMTFRIVAWAAISIAAACADQTPLAAPATNNDVPSISLTGPTSVLVGAGNIARCDRSADEATGRLLDTIAGTVFTTGDNVFASGSASDYTNCYGPSWGRHKTRTRPAAGDLDYQSSGAAGYFGYFGAASGEVAKGYYSYDLPGWHIVVLNSAIAMTAGSAQEQWLRADLAAHPSPCTLAYWHLPRFSSFSNQLRPEVQPLWDALYAAGAELVLNGHYRHYERFAPQTPGGQSDPATGIRQITIGTGGISTNSFGTPVPNSEVRQTGLYGVLKLSLSSDGYQWKVIPVGGSGFVESGTAPCHGAPNAAAATIDLTPASASLLVGQSLRLSAVVKDASGFAFTASPMVWSSTDTLTVKVVAGLVTGIATGTAYVIASSGAVSDTATISVRPVPVARVAVTPATATVIAGQQVTLTATTSDSVGGLLAGRQVAWSSNAPAVATVAGGVVTGVTAGSAVITATSEGQTANATITVSSLRRPGWYVMPNGAGTTSDDGSWDKPWSLTYALGGAGGRIRAGDTVWVRGGTYNGRFRTALAGLPGSPIVFRQYPGERATIDGSLRVDGADVVIWGLEIMQSDPLSLSAAKVPGIETFGARTKLINLVIHDVAQQGITFWDGADDAEVYGCVVYNNGTHENLDHGTYVHNSVGTKLLADNIFFNNMAFGVHVYAGPTDAVQRNVHVIGNVAFNNGSISVNWPARGNMLIGAEVPNEGMQVQDNMLYFSGAVGWNLWVGYTASNRDIDVRRNTIWGGGTALVVGQWSGATIRDNRVGGTADMVELKYSSVSGQSWSGNAYYRPSIAAAWRYSGTARVFTDWQTVTGLGVGVDAAGMTPPGAPTVFVRPNKYEAGRATIVVYNWAKLGTVSADLSSVLTPGDRFEVRNVQALYGSPVVSGTYAGGSILLPMNGVAPPARIGRTTPTPPWTGPAFDTFIVTKVPN